MLSVVMLSIVILSVVILSVVILSVFIQSVVILSVVILSVVSQSNVSKRFVYYIKTLQLFTIVKMLQFCKLMLFVIYNYLRPTLSAGLPPYS
jgi:hypothetical protein